MQNLEEHETLAQKDIALILKLQDLRVITYAKGFQKWNMGSQSWSTVMCRRQKGRQRRKTWPKKSSCRKASLWAIGKPGVYLKPDWSGNVPVLPGRQEVGKLWQSGQWLQSVSWPAVHLDLVLFTDFEWIYISSLSVYFGAAMGARLCFKVGEQTWKDT